jgi:hypothetical protein
MTGARHGLEVLDQAVRETLVQFVGSALLAS